MSIRHQKRSRQIFLGAVAVMIATSAPALSDSPAPSGSPEVWECPQSDGMPLYTNYEMPGCRAMDLKPLLRFPSPPDRPNLPQLQETVVPRLDAGPPEDVFPENFLGGGFGSSGIGFGYVHRGGFGSSASRFGGAYS